MAKEKQNYFALMVNGEKAERAKKAVEGKGKPGSVEVVLKAKIQNENPDIQGDELVFEIYKGMAGLVNQAKAMVNRKNEAKNEAKNKAKKAKS